MPSRGTSESRQRWQSGLPPTFGGAWICPSTGEPLELVLSGENGCSVLSTPGRSSRCWPVVDGVPFLRSDRTETADRVVDAIASGQSDLARSLLFTEPRDLEALPNELCDSGSVRARLRLVTRFVRRVEAAAADRTPRTFDQAEPSEADELFDEASRTFGFERRRLHAVRWTGATTYGLSARALLTLHPPVAGVVLHSGCSFGGLLSHLRRHKLDAVGTDPDWTSLWIARHLLGCEVPLACIGRDQTRIPVQLDSIVPVTHVVGPAASVVPFDPAIASAQAEAVGPKGRLIVASVPYVGLPPAAWQPARASVDVYDRDELVRQASEFRKPDSLNRAAVDEFGSDHCFSYTVTPQLASRTPKWELMLPPDGTRLRINPLYRQWRTHHDQSDPNCQCHDCDSLSHVADLLHWRDDEVDRELLEPGWTAADVDVIELLRTYVLVPATV